MAAAPPVPRGAFIVIEGLDRSGKTTQVELLKTHLAIVGIKVEHMRFPDRTTTIGKMIGKYLESKAELEDHVIHLLFSANRWELAAKIESTLAAGITILCDRYTHSGAAYSAAKLNPLLSLAWARSPDIGLPRPDMVVYLDITPEEAAKRGGYGEEKYEKSVFQQEVGRFFKVLQDGEAENAPRGGDGKGIDFDMVVIDASKHEPQISACVYPAVIRRIEEVRQGKFGAQVRRVGKLRDDIS